MEPVKCWGVEGVDGRGRPWHVGVSETGMLPLVHRVVKLVAGKKGGVQWWVFEPEKRKEDMINLMGVGHLN
jgi:hypothetical protein